MTYFYLYSDEQPVWRNPMELFKLRFWPLRNVNNVFRVLFWISILTSIVTMTLYPIVAILLILAVFAVWNPEFTVIDRIDDDAFGCGPIPDAYPDDENTYRQCVNRDRDGLPPVVPIETYGAHELNPYNPPDIRIEGNPMVGENNPMGNPTTYQFYQAVNMDKPRVVQIPKQQWAEELYRENGRVPDGFWLNPIPDQTLMARGAVYFPESSEEGRSIIQDMGTGYIR